MEHDLGTSRSSFCQRFKPLHGFTLVELLVVISIIALLVALLLPALQHAREQARVAVCAGNIRQIALSMILYAEDHRGAFARSPTPTSYGYCSNGEQPDFRALIQPYAPNPHVFYCPSGGFSAGLKGQWYIVDSPTAIWGWNGQPPSSIPGHPSRFMAYQIWPSDEYYGPMYTWYGAQQDVTHQTQIKSPGSEVMVQDLAYSTDASAGSPLPTILNHPQALGEVVAVNVKGSGFNVGFHDGHVSWTPLEEAQIMAEAYGGLTRGFR